MSATILSDAMVIPTTTTTPQQQQQEANATEIESATCECCGLTEDCTPAYISGIRERYMGRWMCGLCGEAIKDEILRSKRLLSTEEAMAKHITFFTKFNNSVDVVDPTVHLISAVRRILRRGFDGPRSAPATPTSKNADPSAAGLARSESCFSALSG